MIRNILRKLRRAVRGLLLGPEWRDELARPRQWHDEIERSKLRLDKLELLLTEHPDAASASAPASSFPSPAVTVIMPTWNRAKVIGAAIRSVQAQSHVDWELIVIDDGSTDETADIVGALAADRRIRYHVQAHSGQCVARNHALRLARGALIAYLDSDNVWYPDFLAAAVALLAARPDVDCAYGAMITEWHLPAGQRILFESFDRKRLLDANYIGMSTFVHRRSLVDRYGGFDEELGSVEDWDLILRYTSHAPAHRLPVLAVRYRVVDDIRVTDTKPLDPALARVRAKWQTG
jgi:glycosyltransferase involved in cell wall biosynthesis